MARAGQRWTGAIHHYRIRSLRIVMPPVIRRYLNRDLIMSPRNNAVPIAALLASITLSACSPDPDTSLTAPSDPAHAITVSPSLLAALRDARERVLPTVEAQIQTSLDRALSELQSALDAGQLTRTRRAVATTRALIASHAGVSDTDLADLASVGVLLMAVDEAVKLEQ